MALRACSCPLRDRRPLKNPSPTTPHNLCNPIHSLTPRRTLSLFAARIRLERPPIPFARETAAFLRAHGTPICDVQPLKRSTVFELRQRIATRIAYIHARGLSWHLYTLETPPHQPLERVRYTAHTHLSRPFPGHAPEYSLIVRTKSPSNRIPISRKHAADLPTGITGCEIS